MPSAISGRYVLHELLGTGGAGAVYRAMDRLTGATVALKRVKVPAATGLAEEPAEAAALRLALANEFRTLASLRHPNLVGVLDYGFETDPEVRAAERQPYFTMEYLAGAQTITQAGVDRPAARVELVIQVLQALAYIHRRGIVHRDLKPGNVLVTRHGNEATVKVLDFGLAAIRGAHPAEGTAHTGMSGTIAYMAPETLAGRRAEQMADLYALGVIAYELFAGRHPFDVSDVSRLLRETLYASPDLAALEPDGGLAKVVGKLLAKDPAARYESAEACLAALCRATGRPTPPETIAIRESFLQAAQFVGRQAEVERLTAALDRALAGRGSAWLVGGESGVGKTRLLDELRTRALVAGVLVAHGQATREAGTALQLWREPLRRLALTTPLTDLEASTLQPVVPDVATLLDREIPAGPPLEGEAGQRRLLATIADLFRRQTWPVLLILEDLQWAGEGLDVLRLLAPLAAERPLLVVGAYRDDEAPALPATLPGVEAIKLDRLSEAEVLALSESMLGEAGRRPEVVGLLQRESEGNTFFLVEVARALAEEAGRLSDVGQAALPAQVLPRGIQSVVRQRLAGVPAEAQALLRAAAVAGRQVDLAVMAELGPPDTCGTGRQVQAPHGTGIDEWLTACANAAVLEVRDGQWRFAHDKLREGLLAGLPGGQAEQVALHRQVAQAIERAYAGRGLEEHAAALAYHWGQAGNVEEERRFARLAGEQAVDRYANAEALAYLRRGLDLSPADEVAGRYALLMAIERVYDVQGLRQERAQLLDELEALAGQLGAEQQARVALRRAIYAEATSDYPAAMTAAQAAIGWAQATGHVAHEAAGFLYWGQALWRQSDHAAARLHLETALARARAAGVAWLEASSLRVLGAVAWAVSDYSAARIYYEQALEIDRRIGDRRSMGRSLNNLGLVADEVNDYRSAVDYYEQALRIYRDIGDRRGEGVTGSNLGLALWGQGSFDAAQTCFEQAQRICQEVGIRSGEGNAANNLGLVRLGIGDYEAAKGWFDRALAIYRDIGDRRSEGIALANLASACRYRADLVTALDYAHRALDAARQAGHRQGEAQSLTVLGHGLADLAARDMRHRERLAEAATAYREAANIRHSLGDHNLESESVAGLARVVLAQGQPAEALRLVEKVLAHLAGEGDLYGSSEAFLVYLTCYQVLRACGDGRAGEVLATAQAALIERAARIGDEEMRHSFLEDVPHHRAIMDELAICPSCR